MDVLRGCDAVVIAIDEDSVVGYAAAISDGVLSAFIPLLDALPAYRSRDIPDHSPT